MYIRAARGEECAADRDTFRRTGRTCMSTRSLFFRLFSGPLRSDLVEGDYSLEYRILDQVHLIPKAELLLDIVLVALDCLDADA